MRISEEHAYFMIKQHKRTEIGRMAIAYIEKKYDTDSFGHLQELALIEAYIGGFGDGYADARRVTLEANHLDHGECDLGTHPENKESVHPALEHHDLHLTSGD